MIAELRLWLAWRLLGWVLTVVPEDHPASMPILRGIASMGRETAGLL